jgi:hypothetical protein
VKLSNGGVDCVTVRSRLASDVETDYEATRDTLIAAAEALEEGVGNLSEVS